jgi:hypothetical protein
MRRMQMGRRIRSLAVMGTGAILAVGVAAASPAYADTGTISGDVTCNDGSAPQGVWIDAAGGSGFASYSNGVFSRDGVTGPWTVNVGCGGTPDNWEYSVYGGNSTNSTFANWGCYPPDEPAYQTGCFTTAS